MSMLKVVTKPSRPRSKEAQKAALLLAGILIVFVVGQLFSFEKFVPLLETFQLPGGHGTAMLTACLLVISEVFALPFLLRMPVSQLMRTVSMVCVWVATVLWTMLVTWANSSMDPPVNIGFLGASVELPVGWWAISFSLALVVLAGWTTWGLAPEARRKKTQ